MPIVRGRKTWMNFGRNRTISTRSRRMTMLREHSAIAHDRAITHRLLLRPSTFNEAAGGPLQGCIKRLHVADKICVAPDLQLETVV
jgi:hypothetical protein